MKMDQPGGAGRKQKKSFGQTLANIFIPAKGDTPRQRMSKIIAIVAAVLVVAALVTGGLLIHKYVSKDQELKKVQEQYTSSNPSSETASGDEDTSSEPELDPETGVLPEFNQLYATNPDVRGYLKIEGTKLDMPVVQGTDNAYYLDHTMEKKSNPFGIPFADYRATFAPNYQSTNITIYGHSAADGTFFAPVKQYKEFDFYKEHPTVQFDTIYGKGQYKIIGLMMVNTDISQKDVFNFHDYVDLTESQFKFYIENVEKRSYFKTGVDVKFGDQLLTLSTCDTEVINSNTTPYRMALVARKVRPGESADVDVAKASINKTVEMPAGWVKKMGKNTPFD